MSEIKELIIEELEAFNQSIIETLDSKKISNTREAADSLRVEANKDLNIISSIGIFYLEFLDTGRGAGSFPNIAKLKIWVEQKLNITDEAELDQVTFLIARKISQVGTAIFRNNSKGIELDKKVDILRDSIKSKIEKAAKLEVIQKLDKFKNIYKMKL